MSSLLDTLCDAVDIGRHGYAIVPPIHSHQGIPSPQLAVLVAQLLHQIPYLCSPFAKARLDLLWVIRLTCVRWGMLSCSWVRFLVILMSIKGQFDDNTIQASYHSQNLAAILPLDSLVGFVPLFGQDIPTSILLGIYFTCHQTALNLP